MPIPRISQMGNICEKCKYFVDVYAKGEAMIMNMKIKRREAGFYICIGILAVLFTSVFSDIISSKVYNKVHYENITVVADGWDGLESNKSKIVDPYYSKDTEYEKLEYSSYNMEELEQAVVENKGFSVVEEGNARALIPEYEGAYIVFRFPVYPTSCLKFKIDPEVGGYQVYKGNEWVRSFGEYERGIESVNYFMFSLKEVFYIYIWYAFFYIVVWGLLFIMGIICCEIVSMLRKQKAKRKTKIFNTMVIGVFHFLYTCFTYNQNVERFAVGEGADAFYYMFPRYLDETGKLSFGVYLSNTYTFRGFIPHILAIMNNTIAAFLKLDVMYVHFFVFSILIAISFGFIIPMMAECIFESKDIKASPIIMYLLFSLFWRSHFFYYLTDIPAALMAIDSIAYMVYGLKNVEKSNKSFVIAGVFMGGAIGYRSAYSYVAYVALLVFIVIVFKYTHVDKKRKLKKVAGLLLLWTVGVIIVCWPQGIINIKRGHIGLFPYDGGFAYSIEDGETASLMETSFSGGIHSYQFMHQEGADKQELSIDGPLYAGKDYYLIKDILFLILARPKEFFSGYAKKLFWALSAGYESTYMPAPFLVRYSAEMVDFLSILNYLLLWNVLYHIFANEYKDKVGDKYLNIILIGALLSNVLPQGLLHIERRYFLFFYMLIYFYNSYIILKVKDYRKMLNVRYILCASIFSICCYSAKVTLQLNFL